MRVNCLLIISAFSLATQTEAGLLSYISGWHQNKTTSANLDALNKWLVRGLPGEENVSANYEHLKESLQSEKLKGSASRAAEMLVQLVEATKCDDQLLQTVRQISRGRVSLVGGAKPSERSERAIGAALAKLNKICGDYIDETVFSVYRRSLAQKMEHFVDVVSVEPSDQQLDSGSYFSYIGDPNDRSLDPTPSLWAGYLYLLARRQDEKPSGVDGRSTRQRAQFEGAFNEHLRAPCWALKATLGNTLEGVHGLASLQCSPGHKSTYERFLSTRSKAVRRLLYYYKVCNKLQQLNRRDMNEIYKLIKRF